MLLLIFQMVILKALTATNKIKLTVSGWWQKSQWQMAKTLANKAENGPVALSE